MSGQDMDANVRAVFVLLTIPQRYWRRSKTIVPLRIPRKNGTPLRGLLDAKSHVF